MSDDIFADAIADTIRTGKPPKGPKKPFRIPLWLVIVLCATAQGFILALVVQVLIH